MKHTKPISAFLLLFSFSFFYTQTISFDINDYTVATTKIGIIGGLAAEIVLKDKQNKLFEKLIRLEKEIDDKKSIKSVQSLALAAASIATIETTKTDIKNLRDVISIIKYNPLLLKHSLGKKSEELAVENRYLEEAESDYKRYIVAGIFSGGLGQFYTVFGKLLTRILKIRATVLSIKKDLQSLSVINKVLIK
ncbi:MAG: hypothetical protein ACN6N7_01615 [Chryseobacterium culicis]